MERVGIKKWNIVKTVKNEKLVTSLKTSANWRGVGMGSADGEKSRRVIEVAADDWRFNADAHIKATDANTAKFVNTAALSLVAKLTPLKVVELRLRL